MTGVDWFWAGFWATCGVGWAITIGFVIVGIGVFVIAVLASALDRLTSPAWDERPTYPAGSDDE